MMLRIYLLLLAVSSLCFATIPAHHKHLARAPGIRKSESFGGPGGSPFDSSSSLGPSPRLTSLTLRGGNRLDSISFTLASGKTFTHGGGGGTPRTLALGRHEFITFIKLCADNKKENTSVLTERIHYAYVRTNTGRTLEAGRRILFCRDYWVPQGYALVGAFGRSAREVDRLGLIYAPRV